MPNSTEQRNFDYRLKNKIGKRCRKISAHKPTYKPAIFYIKKNLL